MHFTKPGIRASLKKHRIPGQKNAYKALRRLIESAEYDYSVQKDARHKDQDDTEGLDVYRAALRMGGKLYAVTISNDILSERGLKRMTKAALSLKIAHYKDHEPAEIEIAPGVLNRDGLMAAPKEEPPRPTALSRISLGILRGTVKPSKVVGETLLQDTAELNNSLVRGSYDPAANRIYLTPNADLSTFAHEMSHAYLTQLFNLAAISDKGSRAAKDAEILLKAFGLSSLEEYAGLSSPPEGFERLRKIQEWWAYNTEMYLSRGTGADPKAAGVLKKFGAWVRNVYKQYAGGADGYLNLLFRKIESSVARDAFKAGNFRRLRARKLQILGFPGDLQQKTLKNL